MSNEIDAPKKPQLSEILQLQAEMLELPQVELPLVHTFSHGVYARTISIPADTQVIGKMHQHAHLNIISVGVVDVATTDGVIRYVAPCVFESPAGCKRALYTIEPTVWTTIHLTEETDLEKIEAQIIIPQDEVEAIAIEQLAAITGEKS